MFIWDFYGFGRRLNNHNKVILNDHYDENKIVADNHD